MEADGSAGGCPTLGRIGAALAGIALVVPALTVPACLAFAALIANSVLWPPLPPAEGERAERKSAREARLRERRDQVTEASEDSFPASDPPSWTPVGGTGTRH